MTHEELLAKIDNDIEITNADYGLVIGLYALRAVVELLKEFSEDKMLEHYKNSYILLAFQEAIKEQLK